jgi:Tfp pilus assembly protein PilX
MRRSRADESGSALIAAIILTAVMMALGLGALALTDTQHKLSATERARESAFNLSEAALNAQVFQLNRVWPTAANPGPTTCSASAATSALCPDPASLATSYTGADYGSRPCASGTPPDAWTTTIRDDGTGTADKQYYGSTVKDRSPYDLNGNGAVWVRATGVANCQAQAVVALVTRGQVSMPFPASAVAGNWFSTNNQGRKVIVDTLGAYAQPPSARPGPAAQPADVVVRCAGLSSSACLNYAADKGQVSPDTAAITPSMSATTLTALQLQAVKQQAVNAGSYWASGTCPSSAQLSSPSSGTWQGAPVYVEGPCNLSGGGNSATTPGFLVVVNGTYALGGNSTFYGVVYAVNQQNSSGAVVSLSGTAEIQGSVIVDGPGGILAGASKTNIVYDARALSLVRGFAGASIARNTWRIVPSAQ